MKTEAPAYKRVVLKLSGEALQERGARENISPAVVREPRSRPTWLALSAEIISIASEPGIRPWSYAELPTSHSTRDR